MWHAKRLYGYDWGTTEWADNVREINNYFNNIGWKKAAQAGMIANFQGESGMNPWAWQDHVFNPAEGYGLAQWTPGSQYAANPHGLSIPNFYPNYDSSWTVGQPPQVASTARPEDGLGQCFVMETDPFEEWCQGTTLKVPHPNTNMSEANYQLCLQYAAEWGQPDGQIFYSDFQKITDVKAAVYLWLSCWEYPGNFDLVIPDRLRWGQELYDVWLKDSSFNFMLYLKPRRRY